MIPGVLQRETATITLQRATVPGFGTFGVDRDINLSGKNKCEWIAVVVIKEKVA